MHIRANGPTARARARKKRKDEAYAATIREKVDARDGHCRYGLDVSPLNRSACNSDSQWAHWGPWQRFKTRGLPPEQRHTTRGSLKLCGTHHADYDEGRLAIAGYAPEFCDGPLAYRETRDPVKERRDEIE